jgi:Flp pilus assembly protein TadG
MRARRRHIRARRLGGQSLVEFALIAPVLIVLIVGAAQVAAILYAGITVASAAHDGAKVASEQPINSGAFMAAGATSGVTTTCPSALHPVVCNAVTQSKGLLGTVATTVAPGTPAAVPACSSNNWAGDGYVTVTVSNNVPIFVPFLNNLLATPGQTYRTISTTVVMRIEPCTMMSTAAH